MRTKSTKVLEGLSMLPTATRLNVREPLKSSAYEPGQITYILESTDPEDLKGGPVRVAFTTFEEVGLFGVGDNLKTKHFSEKKNLPSRKVVGIRFADGRIEGDVPVGSLPHWEYMDGTISASELQARIARNVTARNTKPTPKATTAAPTPTVQAPPAPTSDELLDEEEEMLEEESLEVEEEN